MKSIRWIDTAEIAEIYERLAQIVRISKLGRVQPESPLIVVPFAEEVDVGTRDSFAIWIRVRCPIEIEARKNHGRPRPVLKHDALQTNGPPERVHDKPLFRRIAFELVDTFS